MKLVVIESPFKTSKISMPDGTLTVIAEEDNLQYARACARDCLLNHQEAPWGSHLLYPQPGLLSDANSKERDLGIRAGLVWARQAELTVIYVDRGLTQCVLKYGIPGSHNDGRPIELRMLGSFWTLPGLAGMGARSIARHFGANLSD